jgi:tetratricopeptide (TPR) repeat protein
MASTAGENQRTPRVFISYSHDSAEHCDRVLMLAQQLRRDGIDAELDQFHQDELLHWPRWCEERLRPENSEWVLCICTLEYKHRVEGRVAADVGKGVFWEGTLIYNYLYDEKGNRRCIPVSLNGNPDSDIPATLNGYTRFQITALSLNDPQSGYANLYRLLTGQSTAQKAGLGELHKLPALSSCERLTDFTDLINQILAGIIDVKSDTTKIKSDITKILSILETGPPPQSTPERPHNLPPWMRPEYFIGRDKELRELCAGLTAPGENALAVMQAQIIHGEGGLGKTRLAIQAVWVLYLQYQCEMAFVISASSPAELDTQLAALDAPSLLHLYDGDQPPRELDIRKQNVIAALREKAGRWILVLDAADSEKARDAVSQLLSQLAGGRFLVTSRREDWPRSTVRKLPLDLFSIEEARACLLSRYRKSEPPVEEIADFDRVATELGFLPLALVLAASYMDSRRIAPARYMDEWKQKHDTLPGYTAGDVEQGRSLLAAFKLSYDLLSPQAAHLLHMLAWLAPEPFSRRLVEESKEMSEMLSAGIKGSAGGDPTNALTELSTLSLLQLDDESLRLHRLVLKCARTTLSEHARATACAAALKWINSILPRAEYDETGWKLWNSLSPHLDEVIAAGNALEIESKALGAICGKLGDWLFYQARHKQAEPLMRRALAIGEKSYGPEHPNVATALNNLAQLLQATNRLEEAEPLMRRALAIGEKSYGREHPSVATALNNLAQLLQATNRLEEAEPLMRRALAIDEKSYGPEHPSVAIRLNNLALLLQATDRLEEAEPLMQRGVEILEKSIGKNHPNVASALNNLALLLKATNRLEEAEPLVRRALAIDEKSYGPEHPEVAVALNNLALLLQDTNRLEEAEPLTRRVVAIFLKFTRSTGHLHPHLKPVFGNYRGILEAMSLGEEEIARRIAEVGKEAGLDEQSYYALVAELSR